MIAVARRRYRVYCPALRLAWRTRPDGSTFQAWCSFDSHRKAVSAEAACAKPCPQCGGPVLIHPGDPAFQEWWDRWVEGVSPP
jgi:hypothetical protein